MAYGRSQVTQPTRGIVEVPGSEGIFGSIFAVNGEIMGVNLAPLFADNVNRSLPTHLASILCWIHTQAKHSHS